MSKGISVFLGMNYSLDQALAYIDKAQRYGFDRVFTSLHIPEADYATILSEFRTMVAFAQGKGMHVTADMSPRTFTYLNAGRGDFKVFKDLGLYGIRVDFGFSPQEIAAFTRNPYAIKVTINASTVTPRFLQTFEACNPEYDNLQACHNYYLRKNTGISFETYLRKNALLRQYNVELAAFIPSLVNKRGPLFEGLPTLEQHRCMEPQIAAKHLLATGTDTVLFGDSMASDRELESVGRLQDGVTELRVTPFTTDSVEKDILFGTVHEGRPDCAEDVVRSASSREHLPQGTVIRPFNTVERKTGDVTIDNSGYLRYCGELQICKKRLPADERVNVVGRIVDEEVFLIDYLGEEAKFSFVKSC